MEVRMLFIYLRITEDKEKLEEVSLGQAKVSSMATKDMHCIQNSLTVSKRP